MTYTEMLSKLNECPNVFAGYREGMGGMVVRFKADSNLFFVDRNDKLHNARLVLSNEDLHANDWLIAFAAE